MKTIRVWFVTGLLPPEFSGAGRNDSVLGPSCAAHSVEVTFLALRSKHIEKPSSIGGVPVYWLPGGCSRATKISRLAKTIRAFRVLEAPNAIRMRGFSLEHALLLFLLKWMRPRIPIVVQPAMLGGDDPETLSKRPLGRFQVRQLLKADAVFAMNAHIADQLLERGYPKESIYRTRNPVLGKFFAETSGEGRRAVRKGLGIPGDAVVFATVGVILPRKRLTFVTEGFCRAIENGGSEHTVLVHIGPSFTGSFRDGEPRHIRESQSEEQCVLDIVHRFGCSTSVSFLGEREDIPALLGAVDVLVHASREEGEANVVNEAAAAGVVVVIPTSSIYDDQVPDGYPWRFDVDSTADLAMMLARLMMDSSLREEAGRALREHARQTRSEGAVGKQYAEMLRAVVERQGWLGNHGSR
jgi:glycosyltransferase involved in cell wall biosynthesis